MINSRSQIRITLGYFLLAALLGVVLRFFTSIDIPVNYKFIVHTHSHIALLGWVYLALTTLLYKLYLAQSNLDGEYRRIFWFTQVTLVGMLLTFPLMGYALFSIIFSTLFLFASYWFVWFFLKNAPVELKAKQSYKCIRVALWYLILSSSGPWALGGIMTTLGSESVWYRMAIYFYLHFLYNGWMIMALVGLFLNILEQHQISVPKKTFKRFFWSINGGIVLSFFLSTLFANPPLLLNILGGIGALSQLIAFAILLTESGKRMERSKALFSPFQKRLLRTVIILLGVKMLLQLLTALPYFANLAVVYLDFTIGYLHLTFLGVVSIGLFLFFDYFGLFKVSKKIYLLYFIGFIITETLLFYKGVVAWQSFQLFEGYFEALALASTLIPLSVLLMFGRSFLGKKQE